MTTSGNLSKVIPYWSNLQTKLQNQDKRIIWLIGPNGSGKSTLCELWMAVVANKRNQKLVYEAGKAVKTYSLPKIISGNVLKVQTVQPIVYDQFPDSIVVDVPTYALPPFNQSTKKMWNLIDSKVTYNYLLANSRKSCFVFVIDQKFTRAPMDGTKAALISFIDGFRDHPEQLFQCTAMIISKCPTGFKIDSAITKIQKLVQKLDDPNSKIINDWFQNIKARNAIFAFNKFTKQQDNEKQAKSLYEKVIELEPLDIDAQIIKSFDEWSEELQEEVTKYLSGIQKVFGGLIILIIEIIESLIKNQEAFQNSIDKLVANYLGPVTQKLNKNQNTELPSPIVILSICYGINKLTKDIQGNIFIEILQLFVKYGIVVKGDDVYNGLKERADFFHNFWKPGCDIAGWDVQKCLNYLQEEAGKIKSSPKMTQVIKDSFQQGKSEQFYENLIELVTYFVPEKDLQKSQLVSVWINSSLELAAIQPKTKSLKKFLDIQQKLKAWNKFDLLGNVLAKIAELLMTLNRVPFAVSLFSKCGNPYKGIQVMSVILNDKDIKKKFVIKDFMPYLDFLQQIGLYQKSYQTCYALGMVFESQQERSHFSKYFSAPITGPKQSIIQSFLEKKIKGLDQSETNILKDLAQKLQKDSNQQ